MKTGTFFDIYCTLPCQFTLNIAYYISLDIVDTVGDKKKFPYSTVLFLYLTVLLTYFNCAYTYFLPTSTVP